MTLSFLNCKQDLSHEKLSEKENIFWVFLLRNAFDRYEHFLEMCTSFVLHKMKKTFGRFQVEAPIA
jgi:hypothetical protein